MTLLVSAEELPFADWVVSGIVVIFYFPPEVSESCGRVTIPGKFGEYCLQLQLLLVGTLVHDQISREELFCRLNYSSVDAAAFRQKRATR